MKNSNKNTRTQRSALWLVLAASMASMVLHAAEPPQVRLFVGIVVEGLDGRNLEVLRESFGQNGFELLRRRGVTIENLDYGTYLDAAAASATLSTGASPAITGIDAARIYDREAMQVRPVFADTRAMGNFTNDSHSPRAMAVTTIGDEARIASGGLSFAYSIALTPEQAIALAGHTANSALWLDQRTANWASSTAYKDMPSFVSLFNRTKPLAARMDSMSWTPSDKLKDMSNLPEHIRRYPFRYVFPRANSERLDMFAESPLANREVTDLALELISSVNLGKHSDGVDVLNLAYTLNPYSYGRNPDNRSEIYDAYLKLDRQIETIIAAVDDAVGLDHSLIILAGTPPRPYGRRDDEKWGIPAGELSMRRAASLLNIYLIALHGNGDYVTGIYNGRVFLNRRLLEQKKLDAAAVRSSAATFLRRMAGVKDAFTMEQILGGTAGLHALAIQRNTAPQTAADVIFDAAPGYELIDDYTNPTAVSRNISARSAAATAPAFILAPAGNPVTLSYPVDARRIAPTVTRILRIRSPNGASEPSVSF